MTRPLHAAPDCATRNAAPTTVQAIILSAQSGALKECFAFSAVALFIVAAAICLPG